MGEPVSESVHEPVPETISEADLDALWAELDARMTTAQRAEYDALEAAVDRALPVICAWGNCTHLVDPMTNRIVSGSGPVACPCDHLPGWRSRYPEGQSRPRVPAKRVGRHGSRVSRSAHRFRLPSYPNLVPEWLPATSQGENP